MGMNAAIKVHVPYAEYAKLPGTNISALKELRRSPLHYKHRLTNSKETEPMRLGTAAHVAVLEPDRFDATYATWGERTDSGRMRPRNGKLYDAFVSANAGREILTEDQQIDAMAMQSAVRGCDAAMVYLRHGDPEVTINWTDAHSERPCRGRVDWLTKVDGMPVLVGLKTSRDCRPFIFGSQAAKLSYHLQWAFYHDGYEAITGKSAKVVEIVVESAAPHDVAVYVVPSDVIEQGRAEYRELLELLAECERNKKWPGAVPSETLVSLPSWVYAEGDDVADLGLEGFDQ